MKYNFDKVIDRRGTDSVKYDLLKPLFGRDDLTPMWVADMDFEVPEFIREAVIERAKHPVYGYTARPERFFGAVSGWLERRHGWSADPRHMNFSPGVVPALNMCVLAFTEPGDRVLVQPPVYFPFMTAVQHHHRELVYNQLVERDGAYEIDFNDLERQFRKGVKLMFFCHPHNPVGRAWQPEELKQLAQLCVQYKVTVVSDEIHSDLLLFGNKHVPLAMIGEDIARQVVTCVAPSKTFNLAGLHSSAVVIDHPELKKKYDTMLDHLHVGGGNLFGQVAMEAAYNHGDDWLDSLLGYLEGNFRLMLEIMGADAPELILSPLEATYLAWVDMKALGLDDKAIMKLMLEEMKIAPVDGPRFGPGGESHVRFNIAMPRKALEEALMNVVNAVRKQLEKKN